MRNATLAALLLSSTLTLTGCGSDSASAPPVFSASPAPPTAARALGQPGFVRLGPSLPQNGATVKVVGTSATTVTQNGGFFLLERPASGSYRLEAETVEGVRLLADVDGNAPERMVTLNAVTTMACLLKDQRPDLTAEQALQLVKLNLDIPAHTDVEHSLDEGPRTPFSHVRFLSQAQGDVNRMLATVAAAPAGTYRVGDLTPDQLSVFKNVGGNLARTLASKLGKTLAGWTLSQMGLGNVAKELFGQSPDFAAAFMQIERDLNEILADLTALQQAVSQLQQEVQDQALSQSLARGNSLGQSIGIQAGNLLSLSRAFYPNQSVTQVLGSQSTGVSQTDLVGYLGSLQTALMSPSFPPLAPSETILDGLAKYLNISVPLEKGEASGGLVTQAALEQLARTGWANSLGAQVQGLSTLVEARHAGRSPNILQAIADSYQVAQNLQLQRTRIIQYLGAPGNGGLPTGLVQSLTSSRLLGSGFQASIVNSTYTNPGYTVQISDAVDVPQGLPIWSGTTALGTAQASDGPTNTITVLSTVNNWKPAAGAVLQGGYPGVIPSANVVYDRNQQLFWLADMYGPFNATITADTIGVQPLFGSGGNGVFYQNYPNLGSAGTDFGSFVNATSSLQDGYQPDFRPQWRLPSGTELTTLMRQASQSTAPGTLLQKMHAVGFFPGPTASPTPATSPTPWQPPSYWGSGLTLFTSDSSVDYGLGKSIHHYFEYTVYEIQERFHSVVSTSTGTVTEASAAPVGYYNEHTLSDDSVQHDFPATAGAPGVLFCAPAGPLLDTLTINAHLGTAVRAGGTLRLTAQIAPQNNPGLSYPLDASEVFWSLLPTGSTLNVLSMQGLASGDTLSAYTLAQAMISNAAFGEGTLVVKPNAPEGVIMVQGQFGGLTSAPLAIQVTKVAYSQSAYPWLDDPCVAVSLGKDIDSVTPGTNSTVHAFGRFRSAATDQRGQVLYAQELGDYSTDEYKGSSPEHIFGSRPELKWELRELTAGNQLGPQPSWATLVPDNSGGMVVQTTAASIAYPTHLVITATWTGKTSSSIQGPVAGSTVLRVNNF